MKNLKHTLIILFTATLLFSCSSDDDSSVNINQADLIGTWKLTSETVKVEDCDNFLTITNTTITSIEYSGTNCEIQDSSSFSYTLDGNIVTGTSGEETATVTILELNATTLRVSSVDSEDGKTYESTYTKVTETEV